MPILIRNAKPDPFRDTIMSKKAEKRNIFVYASALISGGRTSMTEMIMKKSDREEQLDEH